MTPPEQEPTVGTLNFRAWCRENERAWPPTGQDFVDYEAHIYERVHDMVFGTPDSANRPVKAV